MSTRRSSPCRARRAARLLLAAALFLRAAAGLPAEDFSFSGDTTTMSLAEGGQHALLTGHSRVESKDLRITADSIELFGKDFIYAQAHGNVHVVDARRGLDLTSQELFYDRDRKIARIRGNATLADLKNEMVVKGGFIEDRDKEQITIVQIGVRIFRRDIVCRSEFARYQRDKKILELSGMPWVSKGQDVYQATRITINLDTEDISLEGSVQGTLLDKGKADTTGAGGTPAASPQKTPAAPPGSPPMETPPPLPSSPAGQPSTNQAPAGAPSDSPASPAPPAAPSAPPPQGTSGGT